VVEIKNEVLLQSPR
jgi:hypothetical protein